MQFEIQHTTRYRYSQPVTLGHNEAHLRPRSDGRQTCESSRWVINPRPAMLHERLDYFGNPVEYFVLQEPHDTLSVTARSTVRLQPAVPLPAPTTSLAWDRLPARLMADPDPAAIEAREFVLDSPLVAASAALAAFAAPAFPVGRPLLEAVLDLNSAIHREFTYDPGFTTVATPLSEVLTLRRGVCQDFAHLAIGCLRSLGVPARYVSGYVESVPPPGGSRLRGADVSHAWFAVYIPDVGWVDLDPTNDQLVTTQHVTTAWGRDYADVTPLKGVIFGGGSHSLEVEVDVTRCTSSTTPS